MSDATTIVVDAPQTKFTLSNLFALIAFITMLIYIVLTTIGAYFFLKTKSEERNLQLEDRDRKEAQLLLEQFPELSNNIQLGFTRNDAEKFLRPLPPSSFVIRRGKFLGTRAISYKVDDDNIEHRMLMFDDETGGCSIQDDEHFDDLISLLEYYELSIFQVTMGKKYAGGKSQRRKSKRMENTK